MTTPSFLPRRGVLAVAGVTAGLLASGAAGCGGEPAAFEDNLSSAQIQGLDRAWTQRIKALTAPEATAEGEATKLYEACAKIDLGSGFLQAVKATCTPTAVSVKLGAVIPERCAEPTSQCVRALDRAKAANDTRLAALIDLSDAVKVATQNADCQAEFTTDGAREKAYRDLSTAYDAVALGAERRDEDIMRLGLRRIDEAEATIASRLEPSEQIARFRQACGIPNG